MTPPLPPLSSMHNLRYKTTLENKVRALFTETWSPHVVLSPSGWIFPLRRGSSSSLLILPGLLRSDRGGLSVSSPSGEREDACSLHRWHKFPALEFHSASFLHWIFLLSYPYSSLFSPLNFITALSLFQPLFSTEFPHWAILILLLFISLMNI